MGSISFSLCDLGQVGPFPSLEFFTYENRNAGIVTGAAETWFVSLGTTIPVHSDLAASEASTWGYLAKGWSEHTPGVGWMQWGVNAPVTGGSFG